jgi:chromate transporter
MAGVSMKPDGGLLLTLAGYFALMSLFAIGGANGAIPEMHRLVVETRGWMTDRQFADMFALAQVTPGPNVIIVTLIGYHVAGIAGALVTTLAMCGPACAFALFVGRVWDRFENARWRIAIQAGLVPISIGLTAASALIVVQAASTGWVSVALTIVAAAVSYRLTLNPLWIFAGAALLGLAGAV